MKLLDSPNCTSCSSNALGTFFHMMWECPEVTDLWSMIAEKLLTILSTAIRPSPSVLLLNDVSQLHLRAAQKHVFFSGLTAAKKLLALRWKPPHTLSFRQWALTFLDIVYLELSTARLHGEREDNGNKWSNIAEKIKEMV